MTFSGDVAVDNPDPRVLRRPDAKPRDYLLTVLPLPAERVRVAAFRDCAPGILCQLLGLWQEFERFDHFGISFRPNLQAFFLAASIHEDFALNAGANEVMVLHQVRCGV